MQLSNSVGDGSRKPDDTQANKTQKTNKVETTIERGDLRSRNGCKNSGKFWWMMKFHCREALTPVLLTKHLQSPYSRDVRIWVSTVFILISLKTESARSVKGPKLQGANAEHAMAKPYLVLTNLVI